MGKPLAEESVQFEALTSALAGWTLAKGSVFDDLDELLEGFDLSVLAHAGPAPKRAARAPVRLDTDAVAPDPLPVDDTINRLFIFGELQDNPKAAVAAAGTSSPHSPGTPVNPGPSDSPPRRLAPAAAAAGAGQRPVPATSPSSSVCAAEDATLLSRLAALWAQEDEREQRRRRSSSGSRAGGRSSSRGGSPAQSSSSASSGSGSEEDDWDEVVKAPLSAEELQLLNVLLEASPSDPAAPAPPAPNSSGSSCAGRTKLRAKRHGCGGCSTFSCGGAAAATPTECCMWIGGQLEGAKEPANARAAATTAACAASGPSDTTSRTGVQHQHPTHRAPGHGRAAPHARAVRQQHGCTCACGEPVRGGFFGLFGVHPALQDEMDEMANAS